MIRQSDKKPEIIEYLKAPPTRQRLVELIGAMGLTVRHLLRRRAPLITSRFGFLSSLTH
jgi:arsenate reductase (glutaredoxin)